VFQMYVTSVSTVSDVYCRVLHLHVAKVKSGVPYVTVGPSYRSCAWEQRGRKWQVWETKQVQIETRPLRGPT
jgi:hypothetical protein